MLLSNVIIPNSYSNGGFVAATTTCDYSYNRKHDFTPPTCNEQAVFLRQVILNSCMNCHVRNIRL